MKRKTLTVLLGSVVLFIWNAVSWMVLPFHSNTLNTIPEVVIFEMDKSMPSDPGVYHYPGIDSEDIMNKLEWGPRIPLMVYRPGPSSFFDPAIFITSFLYNLMLAFLVLQLLLLVKPAKMKVVLTTCMLIGLTVGFASDIPQMNWYLFPLNYVLINVVDHIVGITLVGLVISKVGRFKIIYR